MSAPKRFLGQAMPIPAAPLVNPTTGVVTDVWLSFLTTLFARTGGPAPLAATLPQVAAQAEDTAQGSLLAIIGDASEPPIGPGHGALLATLLAEAEPAVPADDGALLAALSAEPPAPAVPAEDGALLAALLADAEPVFPALVPPATLVSLLLASAAVSGHRALMWDASGGVVHANPSSATYAFAGISMQAAAAGAAVQVVEAGLFVEPSWSWTPRLPVYAGANGALTQAVPATGTLHQVGVAASATSVLVQPLYPILRK